MKKFVNVKARRAERQGILKSVFFVIIISVVLIFGIYYISNMGSEQGIREAAVRTAVECYAIEGIYPPNVQYMEDNYNLSYDKTKYFIHYDAFASNIMPTIEVYEKR